MKRIKSYNDFLYENYSQVDEINLNLFGKFKKILKLTKDDGDKEYLDDIEIINPETKKPIKLSSALNYDKKSGVRKLADLAMAELKDNVKDSKHVSIEQKVTFEFNKELKARQKQSKEWGEEWTKEDTEGVKSEILVKNYRNLSGDKQSKFLSDVVLKTIDNEATSDKTKERRFEMLDNITSNKDAETLYKKLGDVDSYLDDDSGKGQDITQIIMRSKSATLEQRKKALMYDWVASPSSPGSLMMAKHFTDKMNMNDDSKKGLEFREGRGEKYEQKPGGNLEKEQADLAIKAADDIYDKTQQYYKDKGIKTVKVYRGSDDKNPDGYKNAIESWTTSKEVASQYGQYVHSKEIPVERVLMGHFDKSFPDPYDYDENPSKEIVILGE